MISGPRTLFLGIGVFLVAASSLVLWRGDTPASPTAAVLQDNASGYRWCDLGEEFLVSGQADKARYCMQRATELAPNIPPVWVRAANLQLQLGNPEQALRYFVNVLALSSEYDGVIFGYFDRFLAESPAVLASFGTNTRALQAYLRHLMSTHQPVVAEQVWSRFPVATVPEQLAADYVNFLLRSNQRREAAEVWQAYEQTRSREYRRPEQLFNGEFEFKPAPVVFDWKLEAPEGVKVSIDSGRAHGGHSSLSLRFSGQANLTFAISEQVYVTPGRYWFRAYLKTDAITTEGVFFRLFDQDAAQRLDVSTEPLNGTHEWTLVQKGITISAPTNLITIEVRRNRSWRIDNAIRGTAWVDSVSLKPIS